MLTKRQVLDQLVDHFGDNILVLSCPGVSSIVVFKDKAPTLLKLVPSDDDSDLDISIKNLVKELGHLLASVHMTYKLYIRSCKFI